MFLIRLANLSIEILHCYDYVKQQCKDYYISDGVADFSVSVSDGEIDAEDDGSGFDRGYLESLAIYRKIAEKILDYYGFLMHGVVIEAKGQGIAFLAKSGVGKTTHARLWKELLGDAVRIINGDKPLIRLLDGKAVAYGTPWAGKENLHENRGVPLCAVCFIERGDKNRCVRLMPHEGFLRMLPQVFRPQTDAERRKTFELASRVIGRVKFYTVECNTDISAAEIAYKEILP